MEQLPNIGADIVLEFQQSITNMKLFGEAMEALDAKFGNIERRVDSLRTSMGSLGSAANSGTAGNLKAHIEKEINDYVASKGVVISQIGGAAINISGDTMAALFRKINSAVNAKLADAYRNIMIDISPNLQVGKVPITDDDLKEVNKAIARLVRVQLNNLVSALRQHGAGMISAQDLGAIQFNIGRGTVQQIIGKVKESITASLLNPNVPDGVPLNITQTDLNRILGLIKENVKTAISGIALGSRPSIDVSPDMGRMYREIDTAAKQYINNVTAGINGLATGMLTKPLNDISNALRRSMARELGTDLDSFNKAFANHKFSAGELVAADLRRQFAGVERALNRKIGGGMADEVKEIIKQIDGVKISYSPRLKHHLVNEIGRINNNIIKKIREQIDLQFAHMRAEIEGIRVAPKDINRARRLRDLTRVEDAGYRPPADSGGGRGRRELANDPYSRRDNYFNNFGLQGAIVNTLRHIMAGSMVGAPMMLLYQSFEEFKTSQIEQLKMFSNFYAKFSTEESQRLAQGDGTDSLTLAKQTIKDIMPFVKDASVFYAIGYDVMSEVASVGSRLLETSAEVKTFTDVVGKIYNIDREGDPSSGIAPGLEAFMGQFGLAVGELEKRVAQPLAVATNVTNATTEGILNAIMRSGSAFNTAGITPEQAIAMAASSIKFTGLSGENIGNFYKSVLPRLQSTYALQALESIGVQVYEERPDGARMARSSRDILEDVSSRYDRLDSADAREIIMRLFGTYQSSKGTVTLMEFDEITGIMEAIKDFQPERMEALLRENTSAPIIEVQRAGNSMTLALVDVMEELTPEIVAVSRGITELAGGIREHRDALAGFINFLADVVMGFVAVRGMQWAGRRAGVPDSIGRVQVADSVLGNRGILGRGSSLGVLDSFSALSSVSRNATADNRANRAFVNTALADPTVAPLIRDLATLTDAQKKSTQAYIKDNNIRVRDMKDLFMVTQEAKGYTPRQPLTPEQRWGGSQRMAGMLFAPGMRGMDQAFANQFASDLRDRSRFDAISQTKQGRKVTGFLAGMDENELKRFQAHVEEMNKQSGRTVNSMGSLTHAVNTYTGAQARSRAEVRRTNPELISLNDSLTRVENSLGSNRLMGNMRNFDSFIGGLGQKVRGTASAIGGLARTLRGMAWQVTLFAGIGEIMQNLGSNGIHTDEAINLNSAQRQIDHVNAYKDLLRTSNEGIVGRQIWSLANSAWEGITGMGRDTKTGWGDLRGVDKELTKFLTERYDFSNSGGVWSITDIKDFIKDRGLNIDDIMNEFMSWDGGDSSIMNRFYEASQADYRKRMEKIARDDEEMRSINEQVSQSVTERNRRAALGGTYSVLDLPTLRSTIDEEASRISSSYTYEQLSALSKGYASDSEELIRIRIEQNQKIKKLYDDQLEMIDTFISNLMATITQMRMSGAPPEELAQQEDLLRQWERNRTEAQNDFGAKSLQLEQDELQLRHEAAMSRLNREATRRENSLGIQEAVNSLTMDRNSSQYLEASAGLSRSRISALNSQISGLRGSYFTEDQRLDVEDQIAQLQLQIAQERVRMRDLQLSGIGSYKQDLQDSLAQMSNDYLQARVSAGPGASEDSPMMRGLRINQYQSQVSMFDSLIGQLSARLNGESDVEAQKTLQREIRDLQRQSLQAQLGILDEMKNTGGTFNLPDNVRAISYYEYMTRDNTHSTYTVQGGETHISITLPNITDGTSIDRVRQIGKALGEGVNDGRSLRLQKQANPFGYRG